MTSPCSCLCGGKNSRGPRLPSQVRFPGAIYKTRSKTSYCSSLITAKKNKKQPDTAPGRRRGGTGATASVCNALPSPSSSDQHILDELERRNILVFTPSRCVNGKRVVCYDDRYIVKLAYNSDGIIVSNDNYRDLQLENPKWKKFIEDRLLMYTFANDM